MNYDKTKFKAVVVNGKYYIYDKIKYTNKEYANKYNYTKIYKITSPQTDKIYIGSTTKKYLSSRFHEHKCFYNKYLNKEHKNFCSSFDILKYPDASVEVIEIYNCNDKIERFQREKYHIEQNKDKVVNKYLVVQSINNDTD
ncbi:MAG TPA: GIY-YIG nuclease family protein [Allocoleopsis sp.]